LCIVLSEITGKQLQRLTPTAATSIIDVSPYAAGVYLLEAQYRAERLIRRINIVR
jgi:hypothetical protein